MELALIKLREILMSTGMTLEESDRLLGQFLMEEAFQFVECMNIYREDPERFWELTKPKYKA